MAEKLRYKPVSRGWGSPMESLEFFIDNPSGRNMALASTQSPTGISTRGVSSGLKTARA